ncbi:hypothetical protein GLOTRDRAFT_106509 [Gloeophyllum trabeum ATCC 11539]|uniref:Uncharacterized protein n=1 Tax=Gloeophyllum trabeum (strain ATCC 11539 / FP-39264 / Madison 617) TaxID=670483 RepID=S7Q2V7_GLOTA|nr:uncharacterized protein GLOTRDRAFT_106509 [Gloeophyllum trabeum ATCC 11539]EPQ53882.1 hypothetical protein GLOTRDRAFT_106509 [Gloeophyllum trabeum ATCC 11539]
MRECGTPDVPSFKSLRALQTKLTQDTGPKTENHTSSLGNHFCMNDPAGLFAMDWANPLVRKHMNLYPEVARKVSEAWQAGKWTEETDLDLLTPMWADSQAPHRHFYVKEVARLRDGRLVIPIRWIKQNGSMCADMGITNTDFEMISRVNASEFESNYLDLTESEEALDFHFSGSWAHEMPHPIRKVARGRAAFTVFITPWSDDVSGNVSKQFNPHVNMYLANSGLPHQKLAQEFFVRFCSTSPHASSSEQLGALSEKMKPDIWYTAYDCLLGEEIIFRILPYTYPADNPQQSETCSHIGMHGNLFCRRCKVGGSAEEKETSEGYQALFKPGVPRSCTETAAVVKNQLWTACLGVQEAVDTIQTRTGVKDKIASFWIDQCITKARSLQSERLSIDARLKDKSLKGDARKLVRNEIICIIQGDVFEWLLSQPPERYNVLPIDSPLRHCLRPGDHYNPALVMPGVDIHEATPVEILHTYLLGQDKYIWYATHGGWDDKKQQLFTLRLQSSAVDGLVLPPIRARYMVQYKNALVGRHFKALQQLAIFHLHGDLCSDLIFQLWSATGDLGAYLWYHEISDMDSYLADLSILIDNVLDLWALIDPTRIIQKPKLHVLPHILEDIRRFGPALLFATEIFECWNAIFRLCSVLSNHQAPSRDIALTLADMERFKHQVSGGWWRTESAEYVQAGENVRTFLEGNSQLQRRLGWVNKSSLCIGSVKMIARHKRSSNVWREALDQSGIPYVPEPGIGGRMWEQGEYCISRSRDICRGGSWVFYRIADSPNQEVTCGRICKILAPETPKTSCDAGFTLLERFAISSVVHPRLKMPILTRPPSGPKTASVASEYFTPVPYSVPKHLPQDILFLFNAQHDCAEGGCGPTGLRSVQQERCPTDLQERCIVHRDDDRFILNMHAIHNAALIREILPRPLTTPRHYLHPDRPAKLAEIAEGLRISGPAKRAETAAKAAATRARNKRAKEAQNLTQATVEMAADSTADRQT